MRQFDEDAQYMQIITDRIHTHGDQIALNWFTAVKDRKERNSRPEESFNWEEVVANNLKALQNADGLIVEGSRFNYGSGFQTAVALQYKKPVLNLYRKELIEYTTWPDKLFVSGVANPLFRTISYKDEHDLRKIVDSFLDDINPKEVQLDIKISIDQATAQHLNAVVHQTGKNKATIIKNLLETKL
jgi:hypothetical protein